jgi:plastocyanin
MVAAGLGASAVILLAACGSGSSYSAPAYTGPAGNTAAPSAGDTAAPAPGTLAPAALSAADAPVATNTVAIQNFAFAPATVTVKVGTTIT